MKLKVLIYHRLCFAAVFQLSKPKYFKIQLLDSVTACSFLHKWPIYDTFINYNPARKGWEGLEFSPKFLSKVILQVQHI